LSLSLMMMSIWNDVGRTGYRDLNFPGFFGYGIWTWTEALLVVGTY
jgi:hypothetical protein